MVIPERLPKRASRGRQLALSVEDRFDVVPVRVDDERCVPECCGLDGLEQAPGSIAGPCRGENLGMCLIRIASNVPG